ncbi:hypothetical protein QBC32DRAFT_220711 [Pseudoneurospora amorphoporcata]|uniref:Uncharacterized protein n=1 Tax=Pseudoneurospora amorphoporcata TaxID=241081 RepID=A0AAN6NQ02_9PEZI|nr:hypothetical protein QBC32DRAFT_220711 [Pseudoneurospora amorphoporcata]
MAQSHQAPDDSTLRAHPRDSLMNTWIPALFGSAPSRLLKPPPKPKPLDYIYGLNVESTSEHTTTYTEPKDSKSTQSKTSGNTQAVQSSERKSWRSLTSVTMRRLNMSRDSIPSAFAWKSPGETAKDTTIDEAKYKNQNPKHMDKVSNLDINDTILLTQTWEIQNTLQCTKRTVTNSPKQKQNSRNIPMSTERLDRIRAWNVALERRHRLRRRIRRTARSLERYLKERGTPPKPTETAYNSGGTTIQSKIPWPDRIAKICTRFMYFVGFSIILGSCVGIAIVICKLLFLQGHYQRDTAFSSVTDYDEYATDGKACLNNYPCLSNPQCLDTPLHLRMTRLGLGPDGGRDFWSLPL